MSVQIYKPNPKVTGAALSFQASDRDGSLYVNIIRQASWDGNRKKGAFAENRNKPGHSAVIKLSQVEAGSIIDAIERWDKFSAFHSSPKKTTQISFALAEGDPPTAFIFKLTQTDAADTTQKASFFIPISFGEARLIKEYLIHYLHKNFRLKSDKPADSAQEATSEVPAELLAQASTETLDGDAEPSTPPEQSNSGDTSNPIDW